MKGWDGFSKVVAANIAQRTKGQRATKSREAWYRLLESLRDIDVEFLSPRSDVVTEEDVAQGHEFVLHLLSIGLEAYVINADTTRACPPALLPPPPLAPLSRERRMRRAAVQESVQPGPQVAGRPAGRCLPHRHHLHGLRLRDRGHAHRPGLLFL